MGEPDKAFFQKRQTEATRECPRENQKDRGAENSRGEAASEQSSARFRARGRERTVPHVVAVLPSLSGLLGVVAAENLSFRYQPVIVLVTWRVSPLFVQLVGANADLLLQVQRRAALLNFNRFWCRHDCNLPAA